METIKLSIAETEMLQQIRQQQVLIEERYQTVIKSILDSRKIEAGGAIRFSDDMTTIFFGDEDVILTEE